MNQNLSTPDVSPLQIVTLVQAVVALLVAFNLDLTPEQQKAIIQVATALSVTLPLADAHIRGKRAASLRITNDGNVNP